MEFASIQFQKSAVCLLLFANLALLFLKEVKLGIEIAAEEASNLNEPANGGWKEKRKLKSEWLKIEVRE